jgi:general stress protein 26
MSQVDLSYEELEKVIIHELDKLCDAGLYKRGILATSKRDHVTARRMRLIPHGITLYAWTDTRTRKVEQIKANQNVALVAGFIQIEGQALLMGHPLKAENSEYIKAYKRKLPEVYENVEKPTFENSNEIELIKIVPCKISMPSLKNTFTLDVLDVNRKEAYSLVGKDWVESPAYRE